MTWRERGSGEMKSSGYLLTVLDWIQRKSFYDVAGVKLNKVNAVI